MPGKYEDPQSAGNCLFFHRSSALNEPRTFQLNRQNREILEAKLNAADLERLRPPHIFWRRCKLRILMVTDRLSFSPTDDFGLGTFVKILLDTTRYGTPKVTLANIGPWRADHANPDYTGESRIVDRIQNFRFDNPDHFSTDKYDVVFLFGISSVYSNSLRNGGTLEDSEIEALNAFQDAKGGLFATGDHGRLGWALCSGVARARDMRYWDNYPNDADATNEVSMRGPRRNDTNAFRAGSNTFDDQSDDVPQTITPRIYQRSNGLFSVRYPHPLLCGPNGVIRVMPDHPHEGECKTPDSLNETIRVGASDEPEYPPATAGGARPVPEIVSWNRVAAGRTSSFKDPTVAHSFPGICAYDGHRAGVGRVVTDSTWHHFVNVNLVGKESGSGVYDQGFLYSAAGQAAFEEIKSYFRNLMVWLCRPSLLRCIRASLLLSIAVDARVHEAVLTTSGAKIGKLHVKTIWLIGRHARDALGRYASQCQTHRLILDLVLPELSWREFIDPWGPLELDDLEAETTRLQLVDLSPVLDVVLGAAVVSVYNSFFEKDRKSLEKLSVDKVQEAGYAGAKRGLKQAQRHLEETLGTAKGFNFLK